MSSPQAYEELWTRIRDKKPSAALAWSDARRILGVQWHTAKEIAVKMRMNADNVSCYVQSSYRKGGTRGSVRFERRMREGSRFWEWRIL